MRQLGIGNITSKIPLNFTKPFEDKFNLSNDEFYQVKNTKGKAKTLSSNTVQHSIPALKLFPPHFKSNLSKSELRSFHRPLLQFVLKSRAIFSSLKKKKEKSSKK